MVKCYDRGQRPLVEEVGLYLCELEYVLADLPFYCFDPFGNMQPQKFVLLLGAYLDLPFEVLKVGLNHIHHLCFGSVYKIRPTLLLLVYFPID